MYNEREKRSLLPAVKKGLTAFQLKMIALICMTLDHIGAYGFEISAIVRYRTYLRIIGRIAAPVFLFLLVQSIDHTRSKGKFLLRLYIAGMCVGLFDTAVNFFFGETLGYFTPGNILFTYFYVVLYAVLLERLITAFKSRKPGACVPALLAAALSLLPTVFFDAIHGAVPDGATTAFSFLFQGLRGSLIPSFYDIDYGIGFVLLGIAMYFARSQKRQCLVFTMFCLISIAGMFAARRDPGIQMVSFFGFTNTFFSYIQCWMILALPLMLLYNGRRGRECKYVFYWYYPLHRQFLHILFRLMG